MHESLIMNILEKLDTNKVAGMDGLSGTLLKDGAKILSKPITDLINLSILLLAFPESCKVAKLKPLFKKGSKLEPKNFRPISLLPLISKVRDTATDTLLILYCHSTDTCLSYLNDKILNVTDIILMTGLILIDLRKAFDNSI